ncbi:Uncharacterized protein FKW44_013779, partial [Caligus rogercresseyi]
DEEVKALSTEFLFWNGLPSLLGFLFSKHPPLVLLALKILNKITIYAEDHSIEILHFAFSSLTDDLLFDEA